jgi:nucleoside-diphosphate-sugar epimerase
MDVLVAGAAGAIGRRLVPQLVERGHRVVATTRTTGKLNELRAMGAEAVVMDGLDPVVVGEVVGRAAPEVVVHQMTALHGVGNLRRFDREFAATNALRTSGTDHLLSAAAAAGARRFVAQSYTGWPNLRAGGAVKTEADPLDPDPPEAQRQTLRAISYLERAVLDSPSPEPVVLRYGSFYGPGASDDFVTLVRKRKLPIAGSGDGVWSFIHIDDAAAATVSAVEGGATGIFNIVDDEPARVSQWLPFLAEAIGAKPPHRVPVWLARLAGGEVAASLLTQVRGSSNAKARLELGWAPRWTTWRDGFRDGLGDGARWAGEVTAGPAQRGDE